MVRFGPRLERKQMVLFRAVDIGAELFAIAAACVRAQMLAKKGNTKAIALADLFCREARIRVDALFDRFYGSNDQAIYRVAQLVLRGEHAWLDQGRVGTEDGIRVRQHQVVTRQRWLRLTLSRRHRDCLRRRHGYTEVR